MNLIYFSIRACRVTVSTTIKPEQAEVMQKIAVCIRNYGDSCFRTAEFYFSQVYECSSSTPHHTLSRLKKRELSIRTPLDITDNIYCITPTNFLGNCKQRRNIIPQCSIDDFMTCVRTVHTLVSRKKRGMFFAFKKEETHVDLQKIEEIYFFAFFAKVFNTWGCCPSPPPLESWQEAPGP